VIMQIRDRVLQLLLGACLASFAERLSRGISIANSQ
jgi:hypothetical protein